MSESDFRECDFINKEMRFFLFREFQQNAYFIKKMYDRDLSKCGKIFYKWYVYANIHLTMQQKNIIWLYLNGDIERKELFD